MRLRCGLAAPVTVRAVRQGACNAPALKPTTPPDGLISEGLVGFEVRGQFLPALPEGNVEQATAPTAPPRVKPKGPPWAQQALENDLWYARFLRFVALGPRRSVSLVAKGKRNAYPVPAHWPIQAKQWSWRTRARAFDEAALADPRLIDAFNHQLATFVATAPNGEGVLMVAAVQTGGYKTPPPEDADDASTEL